MTTHAAMQIRRGIDLARCGFGAINALESGLTQRAYWRTITSRTRKEAPK